MKSKIKVFKFIKFTNKQMYFRLNFINFFIFIEKNFILVYDTYRIKRMKEGYYG